MIVVERTLGAVVVGGASRRFGSDKALVKFDGRSLLHHQLGTLRDAGIARRVYVGGEFREDVAESEHVADLYPSQGPLGALISALSAASDLRFGTPAVEVVVIVAVDLPLVTPATIACLIDAVASRDEADAHDMPSAGDVAVAHGTQEHWTCLAARTSTLGTLQAMFDAGERAMHRAMAPLSVTRVVRSEREFHNVNDRATLDAITAQRERHG